MNKYKVVTFKDDEFTLEVRADKSQETVWLTQNEMAKLFIVSKDNIILYIKSIYDEHELDFSTVTESLIFLVE